MQKHRGIVVALSLLVLAVGAGCPVYVQDPNGPGPQPGGAPATLIVNNLSAEAIHYIYMSPSAQSTWGPDLLGSSTVLEVGQAFTIQGITAGQWDVKIVDGSGNCKMFWNQGFDPGGTYTLDVGSQEWTAAGGC